MSIVLEKLIERIPEKETECDKKRGMEYWKFVWSDGTKGEGSLHLTQINSVRRRVCDNCGKDVLVSNMYYIKKMGAPKIKKICKNCISFIGEKNENWISSETPPPYTKIPKSYLVILKSTALAQHAKAFAGCGKPEIASWCNEYVGTYKWNCRGSLKVAYWMPLPEFNMLYDKGLPGQAPRWIPQACS